MPAAISCGNQEAASPAIDQNLSPPPKGKAEALATPPRVGNKKGVPLTKPADWDPLAYNKKRGNEGAIPHAYLPSINGPDGEKKHLGKHLPYVPKLDGVVLPAGYLALMWGDPAKGYAKHPNAKEGAESYALGHWYDAIELRKASQDDVPAVKSLYSGWPTVGASDSGKYLAFGGGQVEDEGGKNTIYLAKLPPDLAPGDTVRVFGHCCYHGDYVDFVTLPEGTNGA